ncbi:hypothetical protein EYR40_006698 [Pleurotus pulmonarius]|nr:hypothetical protein EYR36_011318 [Pleurotus pulmonarius]KAF4598343.1 hypothetical protein EYR38_006741 [Pleurotus pulmonarius]KAF4599602.1 hypothetical protein EYR40_006698 [Pleurotus pulmonarius]
MLTARAIHSRGCLPSATRLIAPRRAASHSAHHAPETSEFTTKEGFGGAFWRNTVLLSFLGVACYKYAPEANDNAYLTRWMAFYSVPRDVWLNLNVKHTVLQQESSEQSILFAEAHVSKVHRYRSPQLLDQASPFLLPVGMTVDMSDVVAKRD